MKFITRGYNNIRLEQSSGTVIKTSTDIKLKDEIKYLRNISNLSDPHLKLLFPRLVQYQTKTEPYQLEMEFYPYRNLGNYITESDEQGEVFWDEILGMLFSTIQRMQNITSTFNKKLIEQHCYSMFVKKTLSEYNKLKDNFSFFSSLLKFEILEINEVSYKNFKVLWPTLLNKIERIIEGEGAFNVIHGDMCFSNILLGQDEQTGAKSIKLIDPRGSFGEKGIYGTSLYDFAKIRHSINGAYEFFIYDKFEVTPDSHKSYKFDLEVATTPNKQVCEKIFASKFASEPHRLQQIKLIEGLIFVGMCARHYDSLERQKAMYLTGIKILNEVIDENLC